MSSTLTIALKLALFVVLGAFSVGCSTGRASPTPGSSSAVTVAPVQPSASVSSEGASPKDASPPSLVRPARTGPLDVTFAVVSDTHLGFEGNDEKNRALVASLAALPKLRYPGHKEPVGSVRGLLIAGDLTEWGNVSEWEAFRSVYNLGGGKEPNKPGSPFPVFEVIGNHDMVHGPWLIAEVEKRHPGKGAYSWDWGDVHLVGMGEAPEGASLDGLERDLANVPLDRPLVLLFHRPLAGPWQEDRPDAASRLRLAKLLEGREVLGIFHGHHHARAHYTWQGYDVFKPGAVKGGAPELAVVHVVDDRMTVTTFDWQSRRFVDVFTKRRKK